MATSNAIPIRLFIITPYPYVVWTLERLIESNQSKMETVGSASTCVEALREIDGTAVDIIILDADIGREECIASISKLKTSSGSKVLVLTGLRDESLHGDAALAGASGVVKTESPARTILLAINKVYEGQLWLDRAIASRIFHQKIRERSAEAPDSDRTRIARLTKREKRTLGAGDPSHQRDWQDPWANGEHKREYRAESSHLDLQKTQRIGSSWDDHLCVQSRPND